MSLPDCPECGAAVRLGAQRVRVGGKGGVYNYIAHMNGTPMHGDGWSSIALKPYAKKVEDRPNSKLIERWKQHASDAARAAPPVPQGKDCTS